jgi:hypothetical protein
MVGILAALRICLETKTVEGYRLKPVPFLQNKVIGQALNRPGFPGSSHLKFG